MERDFLDADGNPMADDERAFWENAAACIVSSHPAMPMSHPDQNLIAECFAWADAALEVYRKRLRDKEKSS